MEIDLAILKNRLIRTGLDDASIENAINVLLTKTALQVVEIYTLELTEKEKDALIANTIKLVKGDELTEVKYGNKIDIKKLTQDFKTQFKINLVKYIKRMINLSTSKDLNTNLESVLLELA